MKSTSIHDKKVFLILFFLLFPSFVSATQNDDYLYLREVTQYISTNFGEHCFIIQKTDFEFEVLKYFDPRIQVIGDFDGNGFQDIALIIKCPNKGIFVTAFHKSKEGFKHFILESRKRTDYFKEVLSKEGPGKVTISMADEPQKTKKISNVAIAVNWLETCYDVLFVWEEDKYISYYRGL